MVKLGRTFEARGWTILAAAKLPSQNSAGGGQPVSTSSLPKDLMAEALALSSTFTILPERDSRPSPPLGDRLADLRIAPARARKTQGNGPAEVPRVEGQPVRATPVFVDDAETSGLRFAFDSGRTPQRLLPETLSGGVGLLDFDGDGWLDVYCVQGGDLHAAGDALSARDSGRPPLSQPRRWHVPMT